MIVNIIMFFTMYPVLLVLYFCFRGQYQYADGCLFAVNMKPEWIKEPEVAAIVEKFRREMKQYFIFLLIVPLSSFLTKYISIQLTIWMMWILLAIVLLCLPLVHANNGLKRWKTEHCLYETEKTEHRIELKAVGKVRRVNFLPFFLPNLVALLLALVPVWAKSFDPALEKTIELSSVGWLTIVMWLCGVALTAVAVWMDRQPTAVINNDSDVNLNYTRARKNIWKNFWLIVLWLNTAFAAVILAASFLADNMGWMILTGSMVPKKVGMGTTMNLATPVGKGSAILGAVVLMVTIPAMCIWLILDEFTPIRLAVEDEILYAKHLNVDYEIQVEDIEHVEKITELPSWSKSSGTAMDTLEKGTFFIRNVGKCEVFLNPENTEFLHFSADGTDYYMSGSDDEQTEEIYQIIQNRE